MSAREYLSIIAVFYALESAGHRSGQEGLHYLTLRLLGISSHAHSVNERLRSKIAVLFLASVARRLT